jgi:hypothetical protein
MSTYGISFSFGLFVFKATSESSCRMSLDSYCLLNVGSMYYNTYEIVHFSAKKIFLYFNITIIVDASMIIMIIFNVFLIVILLCILLCIL